MKGKVVFFLNGIHFYFILFPNIQIFLYSSALIYMRVLILKFYTIINEHQRYKGVWPH